MAEAGSLQTNNSAIAIAKLKPPVRQSAANQYALVLDDIRDPGNLERSYGRRLVWSQAHHSVHGNGDWTNPKCVQRYHGFLLACQFVLYINWKIFKTSRLYMDVSGKVRISMIKVYAGGLIVIGNESNEFLRAWQNWCIIRSGYPGMEC